MTANAAIQKIFQENLRFTEPTFDVIPFLKDENHPPHFCYKTELGVLFDGDCLEVLPTLDDEIIDTVFADPPFNLNKQYGEKSKDNRPEAEYLNWCYKWIDECTRLLKPGGALFIYNLPRWNIMFGAYLINKGLEFRHDIAIEMKNGLPIQGKLYPAHYSLLYFTKSKPKTFRKIRTPIETCRHCGGEVKDYGGHRDAMNPKGVNLKDVWLDIPPVRHWKFKSKTRKANALSTKLLDRVVELTTLPNDVVLDPFGGSGTTYAVCEKKRRRWIGVELDFADEIISRIEDGQIQHHVNSDYIDD